MVCPTTPATTGPVKSCQKVLVLSVLILFLAALTMATERVLAVYIWEKLYRRYKKASRFV